MKLLDRYIIGKFLGTFFFILGMLLIIAVVIDFSEKIDDFLAHDVPTGVILTEYYVNFVPYIGALLTPFFIFIAVIFFTSQLASRSEIIAILATGTTFNRLALPYLMAAAMLSGGLYYSNHYLVPKANKKKQEFETTYFKKHSMRYRRDVHRQLSQNGFFYVKQFNARDTSGIDVALEWHENNRLKQKITARTITWNDSTQEWILTDYRRRVFLPEGERIENGSRLDTTLNLLPSDFTRRTSTKDQMSKDELWEYIQKLKASSVASSSFYEIEYYRRTASAFSIFILTIMGLSVASRKTRGGMGYSLVFGIAASALYIVTDKFTTTFSTNATLPAVIGVWLPNLFFGLLAYYLYRKASK